MPGITRYRLSPERSTVTIVGETSLHPITVNVTPDGWLEAQVQDGEFVAGTELHGEVEIAVIEFRSGNPLVDRETRRRLNAKRYPTIKGMLSEVLALDRERATVRGVVTFLGRDVELDGDLTIVDSEEASVNLVGDGQMNVQWWGLEPPTLMVLKMDPVVSVSVDLHFERFDAG
ncbi:MAG: YceI family protein [Acidimicrobiia bacterium]|nr:YceI family protein [Acidimicrobiia bacterium]